MCCVSYVICNTLEMFGTTFLKVGECVTGCQAPLYFHLSWSIDLVYDDSGPFRSFRFLPLVVCSYPEAALQC